MEVSRIVDLPCELVLRILDAVDNVTFCALRLAHSCFNLYDDDEVERKRKVPHWSSQDPSVLCARGVAGGVRLWLDAEHPFSDADILGAIASGHVDAAMLFVGRISSLGRKARTAAIRSNSVDMSRLIGTLSHFTVEDVDEAADECACGQIMDFLAKEVNQRWPTSVMRALAKRGLMDAVRAVWRHHPECMSVEAVVAALRAGHTDIALFFAAEAVDPTMVAMRALPARNMDIIAKLHAHIVSQSHVADAIAGAARRGRTDILSVLVSRCTESLAIRDAACDAATHWHTEAALILAERCSGTHLDDVLLDAAKAGSDTIVDTIVHRCSAHGIVGALHAAIGKGNDYIAITLLRRCPLRMFGRTAAHSAMVDAARSGMKRTVAMLYDGDDHDDKLFATAVVEASARRHVDVVRFFMRKRPRSTAYAEALYAAAKARHVDIVRLFFDHGVDPMYSLVRSVCRGACKDVRLLETAYGNRLWPVDCAPFHQKGHDLPPTDNGPTLEPTDRPVDAEDVAKTVCRQCQCQCKQWLMCVALDGAHVPMMTYLAGMWGWGFVRPT
jgi:hypothetical protein